MTNKKPPETPPTKALKFLLKRRDIQTLWLLRIWLHFCSENEGPGSMPAGFLRLLSRHGVSLLGENSKRNIYHHLYETLYLMEAKRKSLPLPAILRTNMLMVRSRFAFNHAECMILSLAVCLRNNELLRQMANCARPIRDHSFAISKILGIPSTTLEKALEPGSRLRESNLIKIKPHESLESILKLTRGSLRVLGIRKLNNTDELLGGFVTTPQKPTLTVSDYAHLQPSLDALERLLAEALRNKRSGVNLLLHGPPGTGKTELTRVLAKKMNVPLFEVTNHDPAFSDQNGSHHPNDQRRLGLAAAAQFLLGKRKAILCFDEVESIFNDGSRLFGEPSTAARQKGPINRMLESNGIPTFWIANSIDNIDPAFVRRFDITIHLDTPPEAQRLRLLERECGAMVSPAQLRHLSKIEHITPGLVTRASSVVNRMTAGSAEEYEQLLDTVLNGTLRAQRHPPIPNKSRGSLSDKFDPELCNTPEDISRLALGVARTESCRICLYGPPGTGKTAFGHWLAERLNKPIIMKKASDLQSPYLGEMESNLARAFGQAKRDNAVLQIDEVDSFLQDRRTAKNTWEISQVNEFLTQLENFDGVFIASTNLMDAIDQAALRRFDHKLEMNYLRPEQARVMLDRLLARLEIPDPTSAANRLISKNLAHGDFPVVARKHRVMPFHDATEVVAALLQESSARNPIARPIGFIRGEQHDR